VTEQRTYTTEEVAALVRSNLFVWGISAFLFCAVPSGIILSSIPHFESLFKGFGADLPTMTIFMIHWQYILLILPAILLVQICVAATRSPEEAISSHRLTIIAAGIVCGVSLAVQGFAVAALYAPLFMLGAVV
jgi:hypothetical protein